MSSPISSRPFSSSLRGIRKAQPATSDQMVRGGAFRNENQLPYLFEAQAEGIHLSRWIANHAAEIPTLLNQHGGLLFRGFLVGDSDEFESMVRNFSGDLMRYAYRSTPRQEVSGKIYTSTEYPPDQTIPLHNEMSYAHVWPRKIWFHCRQAAEQGGETPIADSREVLQRIAADIRDEFEAKGVRYVRNYGPHLDLSWQEVFQVNDQAGVEKICRKENISFEWLSEGRLRTWQNRPATARHQPTGAEVWFNQAHLFHYGSLAKDAQETLLEMCGIEGLPRNATFGDGTDIPYEMLSNVASAYAETQVVFPWQNGDVLLLDNILVAHGRQPFVGKREVVVGMAEPCHDADANRKGPE